MRQATGCVHSNQSQSNFHFFSSGCHNVRERSGRFGACSGNKVACILLMESNHMLFLVCYVKDLCSCALVHLCLNSHLHCFSFRCFYILWRQCDHRRAQQICTKTVLHMYIASSCFIKPTLSSFQNSSKTPISGDTWKLLDQLHLISKPSNHAEWSVRITLYYLISRRLRLPAFILFLLNDAIDSHLSTKIMSFMILSDCRNRSFTNHSLLAWKIGR